MSDPVIINVINQKGGVGKTTSAVNIGSILAYNNQKVLILDNDAQGSSSSFFSNKQDLIESNSMYEFIYTQLNMQESKDLKETLGFLDFIKTKVLEIPNCDEKIKLDIIPSNKKLRSLDSLLQREINGELKLKKAIQFFQKEVSQYNFIIIDSPPAINMLSKNAFLASRYILVPVTASDWSSDGLGEMFDDLAKVKQVYNVDTELLGVFFANFRANTNVNKKSMERFRAELHGRLFKTPIRNSVIVEESNNKRKTLIEYAQNSEVFEDYCNVTKELLERIYG